MKSFLAPLAFVTVLASSVLAQVTVNTPVSVVVCQPIQFTWTGGTSPYFLSILPANQPSATALIDFGKQTGNSVTWVANLGVGTSVFLNCKDSNGVVGQSGTFTILTGSDTSCVGKSSAAPSATGATSTGAAATASGNSTSTSTGTKSTATTKSAASSKYAQVGIVGMISAAALALFV
ncbi:hypothetical protein K443DRAFT_670981 [Laccaria amethystina LaAM-08-1]|uniref:Uncharacterized protein n=1 Tax=Laccaria amethystina LaAM-08-1 TaxID=1095629 RepID=A0A0C9YJ50_9AGAR|nr:hypothetical protein K443DRAFT_670981 [Laccaria amethystina LaAM-08-1]